MEECSLDLISFNYRQTIWFSDWGQGGSFFSNSLNYILFRQSVSIYFLQPKKCFLQLLLALYACLTSVSTNKYILREKSLAIIYNGVSHRRSLMKD